jgi:hypothetical protein
MKSPATLRERLHPRGILSRLAGRSCAVLPQVRASGSLESKSTLLRIGYRVTRHPRMGAAQQPKVAVREPAENKRLREKLSEKAYFGRKVRAVLSC